jgi:hypothetical protein
LLCNHEVEMLRDWLVAVDHSRSQENTTTS